MSDVQNRATIVPPYSALKHALIELMQQIEILEAVASYKYYEVEVISYIEALKVQTLDFLHDLEAQQNEINLKQLPIELLKEDTSSENNTTTVRSNIETPYHNIVIKVSNNQYVPRVLHPQTIVTYKTDA